MSSCQTKSVVFQVPPNTLMTLLKGAKANPPFVSPEENPKKALHWLNHGLRLLLRPIVKYEAPQLTCWPGLIWKALCQNSVESSVSAKGLITLNWIVDCTSFWFPKFHILWPSLVDWCILIDR